MTSSFPKPSLDLLVGDREKELKQKTYVDPDKAWEQHTKEAMTANAEFIKQIYTSMNAARTKRDKTLSGLKDWLPQAGKFVSQQIETRKQIGRMEEILSKHETGSNADQEVDKFFSNTTRDFNEDTVVQNEVQNAAVNAASKGEIQQASLLTDISALHSSNRDAAKALTGDTLNSTIEALSNAPITVEIKGEDGKVRLEQRLLSDPDNSLDVTMQIFDKIIASYYVNIEESGVIKKSNLRKIILPQLLATRDLFLIEKTKQINAEAAEKIKKVNNQTLIEGITAGDNNNVLLDRLTAADGEGTRPVVGLRYYLSPDGPLMEALFNDSGLKIDQVINQLENSNDYTRAGKTGKLSEVYKDEVDAFKAEYNKRMIEKGENIQKEAQATGMNFIIETQDLIRKTKAENNGIVPEEILIDLKVKRTELRDNGSFTAASLSYLDNMIAAAEDGPDDVKSSAELERLKAKSDRNALIYPNELNVLNQDDLAEFTKYHGTKLLSNQTNILGEVEESVGRSYLKFIGSKEGAIFAENQNAKKNAIKAGMNEIAVIYEQLRGKTDNSDLSDAQILKMARDQWVTSWDKLSIAEQAAKFKANAQITDTGRSGDGVDIQREADIQNFEKKLKKDPKLLLSEESIVGEDNITEGNLTRYVNGSSRAIPKIYTRYANLHGYDPRNVAIGRAFQLGLIDKERANELVTTGDFYKTAFGQELYKEISKNPLSGNFFELSQGGEKFTFAADAFVPQRVLDTGDQYDYVVNPNKVELDKPISQMTLAEVLDLVNNKGVTEVGLFGLDKDELNWALSQINPEKWDDGSQVFDEEFQRRLPQLIMRAKCKLKHGVTAADTPKTCNPIELDFQSDIEENEAVLQVLNTAGEVDTTHFSNQPNNLSAGLVELLMKELQD